MNFIIMGVCGSGKTTVASALANELNIEFKDADEFHPESNKEKMSRGIPLTDEDRFPWLLSIHNYICNKKGCIVTCSGLKHKYRQILLCGEADQTVATSSMMIMLVGKMETIHSRLKKRTGHFMPTSLLESQMNTLEMPLQDEHCLIVDTDIYLTTEDILTFIKANISS